MVDRKPQDNPWAMPNQTSTMYKLTELAMHKQTEVEHARINRARGLLLAWANPSNRDNGFGPEYEGTQQEKMFLAYSADAIIPIGTESSFAAIAHDMQIKENAELYPAIATVLGNMPTAQEAADAFKKRYEARDNSILTEANDEALGDPSNPKDSIGRTKLPLSLVPAILTAEASLAFLEGKLKYGEVNWRATSVYLSVYLDALMRHIEKYSEGDDRDPITKVHHLGNAAACIGIILDAEQYGTLIDDRKLSNGAAINRMDSLSATVGHLQKLFADKNPAHYKLDEAMYYEGNTQSGSHGRNTSIS